MSLSIPDRQLLKAAIQVRDSLFTDWKAPQTIPQSLIGRWSRILRLERQLRKSEQHGYVNAGQVCLLKLKKHYRLMVAELSAFEAELNRVALVERPQPSIRLLYDELQSLADEFATVDVDHRMKEIVVHTQPIVLEEVELGRFEICLSMINLQDSQSYRIVALDPNSAVSDDSVTHPHVQSERLCAGDGSHAISAALAEGRLSDFFLTVRQILQTYNPSSAYVSLDDWCGSICTDCGETVPPEETSCCERCDSRQCERCTCSCQDCNVGLCGSCIRHCADCEECTCRNCLKCCQSCEDSFCHYCLEDGLCQNCQDQTEEPEHAEPKNSSDDTQNTPQDQKEASEATAASDNSLQPVCLGEVTLSA